MPEKCAYIRAVGGISGDMLLGALIDVEADIDFITQQLNSLNLGEIELEFYNGIRKGVLLSVLRVLRCNPFGTQGYDPVPLRRPDSYIAKRECA